MEAQELKPAAANEPIHATVIAEHEDVPVANVPESTAPVE